MDLLSAYRVLDLTNELGWLCGRILSDLGADVIKVEPPGGDPGRTHPPTVDSIGIEWLAFNAGKRGITLSIETPAGRDVFLRLADTSHFVIETFVPEYLDTLDLGWKTLHARNPRLILTSITPYGQEGPDALAPASDLELMAASGAAWLAGDPDRPPVRISQPQASLWASMHAAMGTLIAHHFRERTGEGQHVDAAAQAGVIWALSHAPTFWDMLRENPCRSGPFLTGRSVSGAAMRNIWPCNDGFVAFAIYGGDAGRHTNRQLTEWMASQDMAPDFMLQMDWDRFDVATITPEDVHRLEEAIGPFFLTLTKQEFFKGVIGRRMLGYPVATAEDISADDQLVARGVWQDVFDPHLHRSLRYPGGFGRFDGEPTRVRRPAPAPGEHNVEIFCSELGLTEEPIHVPSTRLPRQSPSGGAVGGEGWPQALSDLRVVEFGGFAAGPGVSKHLADHGAEVIRVESRTRLDGFRTNYPPYKDNIPGIERAGMFAITNNNKMSVTLNLKTPDGVNLARRLVERADVVVENFTPGTMSRLGLSYEILSSMNPRLVLLSTCNQGQTGPHARHAGFGTHLTALSGFTHLTGWPDRAPSVLWGPYIDYIAIGFGVIAILAALGRRRQTGKGCTIDLSQYETGLQFMTPALLDYFANGHVAERAGNRHPTAAPHGVYPCKGEECWCALSVHDDEEWERFRSAIGDPEWARSEPLKAAIGRKRAEAELDRRVAEWTAKCPREEVLVRLRRARVHVAPVNNMADLHADPQLKARQVWRSVEHPVIGRYYAEGPPFLLSKTPAEIHSAAPLLGQHNEYVFCEQLGLSKEKYERHKAAGVFE